MVKKILEWILKHEWLLICLATIILLRIPSFFEPVWYGDEAIYLTVGQALRKGVILYSQIHDNKPPLLYLVAAAANGNLYWFKFWAAIFNLLSIGLFYKLAQKLSHGNKLKTNIALWVFGILTTLPLLEGNIANAELFFLLFTIGAFYVLWREKSSKQIFWGGVILGLGALFKMPPLLEAGVWPIYWLFTKDKKWFNKSLVLGSGVLLPILTSAVIMTVMGAGREYLTAAWLQNLPYLTSWKATTTASGIYSLRNRILMLIAGIMVVGKLSKTWQKSTTVIAIWTLVTWFAALLSGRPYPHYLLQMAPVIALWSLSRRKAVTGGTLLIITWSLFQFYIYPVWGYYANFGSYIQGQKSLNSYFDTLDANTSFYYWTAEKIKALTTKEDKIFVWGDTPMLYAVSNRLPTGKYIVKYHILELDAKARTMDKLRQNPPKLVVLVNEAMDFPELSAFTRQNYMMIDKMREVEIWKTLRHE